MLILSSPAKSLDLKTVYPNNKYSIPEFLEEASLFARYFKGLSKDELTNIMSISSKIASENKRRFEIWDKDHNELNSSPMIFTYKGDIFKQLELETYNKNDLIYLNNSLRVITAFYGILKPFDLMQPYRLEMKTSLKNFGIESLKIYWAEKLTMYLNKFEEDFIINLCSKEYSDAIDFKRLNTPVVDIVFQQNKGNKTSIIGIYVKKARGQFLNYCVKNRVNKLYQIEKFNIDDYKLMDKDKQKIVFQKSL